MNVQIDGSTCSQNKVNMQSTFIHHPAITESLEVARQELLSQIAKEQGRTNAAHCDIEEARLELLGMAQDCDRSIIQGVVDHEALQQARHELLEIVTRASLKTPI
jgi:hypothetical protein